MFTTHNLGILSLWNTLQSLPTPKLIVFFSFSRHFPDLFLSEVLVHLYILPKHLVSIISNTFHITVKYLHVHPQVNYEFLKGNKHSLLACIILPWPIPTIDIKHSLLAWNIDLGEHTFENGSCIIPTSRSDYGKLFPGQRLIILLKSLSFTKGLIG